MFPPDLPARALLAAPARPHDILRIRANPLGALRAYIVHRLARVPSRLKSDDHRVLLQPDGRG